MLVFWRYVVNIGEIKSFYFFAENLLIVLTVCGRGRNGGQVVLIERNDGAGEK